MSDNTDGNQIDALGPEIIYLVNREFDVEFYLRHNEDVRLAGLDPLSHYLEFGAADARDPNASFSTSFYASAHSERIPKGMHPFIHYITQGKTELLGTSLRQFFDAAFYLGQNKDVEESGFDPLDHYLAYGVSEKRDPSATFSGAWYVDRYMGGDVSGRDPLTHLLMFGKDIVYTASIDAPDDVIEQAREAFDEVFYRSSYLQGVAADVDALSHFLTIGWLLGFDPNTTFSTSFYAKLYRSHMKAGENPLIHYIETGKKKGFCASHHLCADMLKPNVASHFDPGFYLSHYDDIRAVGHDPYRHYMIVGWREGKDPNRTFSSIFYSRAYPDVAESGMHPLVYFAVTKDLRPTRSNRSHVKITDGIEHFSEVQIAARQQDMQFPLHLETSKRIAIFVVPEHNEMSGGIFSIFSIANRFRKIKMQHGYDVVVMTNPNQVDHTYCRQTNFRNQEDVFRFEQIVYMRAVEEIYLHVPEYAAAGFLSRCSTNALRKLLSCKTLHINILNQNIELMPPAKNLVELRRIADTLTQSVAHHAYFSQAHTDRYQVSTLLLPAYTDLSEYSRSNAREKDDIVLYSLDDAWYKKDCLSLLRDAFPNYRFIEVRGIKFDHFMDLASRCRFSISFGEGFDGYVAQPIYQGGIGMTVYRKEFFPSDKFMRFPNFFSSASSLLSGIVDVMNSLVKNPDLHDDLNQQLIAEYDKLYSLSDYHAKIRKLANREFELHPVV